jgi:subtilisin family serine protease
MGQKIGEDVYRRLSVDRRIRVIVALKEPVPQQSEPRPQFGKIKDIQQEVLNSLTEDDFSNVHRWRAISAFAGEITEQGLAKLSKDPNVLQVSLDLAGSGNDATSAALIQADKVQAAGFSGKGVVTAILDTGVDSSHPDLASTIIAEQCFCHNGNGTGCCPNGNTSQAGPGSARDDNGHGTNVAGIMVSAGTIAPKGIAPDAKLVAVRVMDSKNGFSGLSQVLDGLDWIIATHPDVKTVNMSLGTFSLFNGACDNLILPFTYAVNALRESGAVVFASSGNNGSKTQISAPSCISNVISMGAIENWPGPEEVTGFTNSNSMLDLLAPGSPVTSTGRGGGISTYIGTSQASPHAAAGAALLLEAKPGLTSDQIEDALKKSGIYVLDSGNGLAFPRIDLWAALSMVLNGQSFLNLWLPGIGAYSAATPGEADSTRAGYAALTVNSGKTPYGTAVFGLKNNNVVVSEAGVPASPPTNSARIFIDYRSNVAAVPGRPGAGNVNTNTGIAVVNRGSAAANVTYTLHDRDGNPLAVGHGSIAEGNYFACFIDSLKNVAAPDFNFPSNFQSATQFGSLEISSDEPLSVLALRGATNQRSEFLITTTPIADLSKLPGSGPIYFPQFVDGGGYTTSLILLNTSTAVETGTLQIMDKDGAPFAVHQVGGITDSSFSYTIPPGGIYHFQADGSPMDTKAGWVRLTPNGGTSTPIGSGIFGYNPADILVSESGIPSAAATTHARVYVDLSGKHNTGLAIANVSNSSSSISINAFRTDGVTAAGTSKEPLLLPGNGYSAAFADSFVSNLPDGFTGVLDIRSANSFAALTLRSLDNERGDFLMTTFPIADENQPAPEPAVFPQIADGGGYTTQFILLGQDSASSITLNFYSGTGNPLAIVK